MLFQSFFGEKHQSSKERKKSPTVPNYNLWLTELLSGFSICLYGYGDKTAILQTLDSSILKKKFDTCLVDCLTTAEPISVLLKHHQTKVTKRRCAILASFDKLSSSCLKTLSRFRKKHKTVFVFSSDNVNISLRMSQHLSGRLSLIWHPVNTEEDYDLAVLEGLLVGQKEKQLEILLSCVSKTTLDILHHVLSETAFASKTPLNKAFLLCKKKLLVSSEMIFRSHLVEFLDHGLLRIIHNDLGEESLFWQQALLNRLKEMSR